MTMRDAFIEEVCRRMASDPALVFLSADLGSPKLDTLRSDYPDRFINVGIAEQNLVNVAAGYALEGFTVYAYAIAPFLVMRAYEQIRNNLSLLSHTHRVNVNLVGVGSGLSYDVSGPTHHGVEDISLMRLLPKMTVFSPSDWVLAERFVDYTIDVRSPKYLRFDGKPTVNLYDRNAVIDLHSGFSTLAEGSGVCIVSTGYMTHTALRAAEKISQSGIRIGVVDVFLIKPLPEQALYDVLRKYRSVITVEEAFVGKGGLDTLVANILAAGGSDIRLSRMGFGDSYVFTMGVRERLHELNGLGEKQITEEVFRMLAKG